MGKTITPVEKLMVAATVASGMLMMAGVGDNAGVVTRAKSITEQLMKAFDITDEPEDYYINGPLTVPLDTPSPAPLP